MSNHEELVALALKLKANNDKTVASFTDANDFEDSRYTGQARSMDQVDADDRESYKKYRKSLELNAKGSDLRSELIRSASRGEFSYPAHLTHIDTHGATEKTSPLRSALLTSVIAGGGIGGALMAPILVHKGLPITRKLAGVGAGAVLGLATLGPLVGHSAYKYTKDTNKNIDTNNRITDAINRLRDAGIQDSDLEVPRNPREDYYY